MSVGSILYTLLISPLRLIFEVVFAYANSVLNHPGLSIVVLSLAINLLVLPLYRRSDAMQEEERDIQAKLKDGVSHIKKTFKGDERMMILQTYYRQNHYKPTYVLRGAMSLFLEIPFFIAAYSFLSNLGLLMGVSFGPIADLSEPDRLLTVFGVTINLLPIVMTAVNCVSTVIFTKGYPAKTKIQLYAMAAFFLVFLYNSPSGLVFYWTLNNVFSLVKTIFYKLKNPKKVLAVLAAICGVVLMAAGALYLSGIKRVFFVFVGAALVCPLVYGVLKSRGKLAFIAKRDVAEPNGKRFVMEAIFLSALAGLLIPSAVIKASPLEFVNVAAFYHPLWYVVSAACMAIGSFVIWFGVFYWLASPTGKLWFERILFALCGVAIVDYMFFGRNLGTLSAVLTFENGISFERAEVICNAVIVVIVAAGLCLACSRWEKVDKGGWKAVLLCSLAMVCMSAINVVSISGSIHDYLKTANTTQEDNELQITLSRTGQNVVVLMLDRAAGNLVPYIMNEKPELAEQFSGFTYYDNVVSYGGNTNFATPSLFGGYEYTPLELNKRDDESLASKQNEALRVMPVMFAEEGYDVTVYDPPYAGYQWIPDLTIYDDYPEIKTGITMGAFNQSEDAADSDSQRRNFFCYSIVKMVPVALQTTLYQEGGYRRMYDVEEMLAWTSADGDFSSYPSSSWQIQDSLYEAHGLYAGFLDCYTVLDNLPDITTVTDNASGSFLMMDNDITHKPTLLQEPDYVPTYMVDNTAYEEANADRFTVDGVTIDMMNTDSMSHYHVNMAALLKLGEWFDYLRELGVYDNTRIILVADHSRSGLGGMEAFRVPQEDGGYMDVTDLYPLLMMKDFGSNGAMETDSTFMTNADVPTLATEGVIETPVNPATGKTIDSSAKETEKVYVFRSSEWDISVNNGNTFLPDDWYSVHDSIWDADNWSYEGYGVLPEGLED